MVIAIEGRDLKSCRLRGTSTVAIRMKDHNGQGLGSSEPGYFAKLLNYLLKKVIRRNSYIKSLA